MGRPYSFKPDELQKKINAYFDWCDQNPFIKYDCVKTGQDAGKELQIKIPRPYTIQGIVCHLEIDRQTWYNWCDESQKNTDLFDIVTRANTKISQNQVEGAGAGVFNPMIIARLQGLTDKQEVTTTTIDTTNKSQDEIRAAIQAIEQARKK